MNKNLTAHLAVLAANILYGANYSIAKLVMPEYIKPSGFIVIRVWIASVLFLIAKQLIPKQKIENKDYKKIILCALFGVAINQLLFFKGLNLTGPIDSGLMMVTNPIFVLLLSGVFLSEVINLKKITGIICGLSGAVLLVLLGHNYSAAGSNLTGDFYILLNSLSFAIFIVLVKPLMIKYHPLTIMPVIFCAGALMVLPFGYQEFIAIKWETFVTSTWMATVFVVVGTTFLAYLFNVLALKQLTAGTVSVYIYLQPLFAVIFAILLGKDFPNIIHLIAAVLIFTGVYLTVSKPKGQLKSEN